MGHLRFIFLLFAFQVLIYAMGSCTQPARCVPGVKNLAP